MVTPGLYRALASGGTLMVADGLRVPPASLLHGLAISTWGKPEAIYCDRFRFPDLSDAVRGCRLIPRVTRWSEASDDIRGLRKLAQDGPLSVEAACRDMLAASLSVATVKNDEQGSVRMVKRGTNNTARDDVAAALVLAAGAVHRIKRRPQPSLRAVMIG